MQDPFLYSEQAIRQGSKSFARAAMLFDRGTRRSVMMLYAWCRYCDDVIDGQTLGHNARALSSDDKLAQLRRLRQETERVCAGESSDLPAFAALGEVVRRHAIPRHHLFDLLDGFAMDATDTRFSTLDDTLRYCYHVAGVVGVMLAHVMDVQDENVMLRAADLGIAFQLTNIARDVEDDLRIGRCYLPEDWLQQRGIPLGNIRTAEHRQALHGLACDLVELAEAYYASARVGMARLPWRSACAIASALLIYRDIGLEIRSQGMSAWNRRIQVSSVRKLWRLCHGCLVASQAVSMKARRNAMPREGLWTKSLS